jgi:TDG/mug DNA glycosylase family protein
MKLEPPYPFPTLPDYLAPGLKLVFVGINPSSFSVERGHYFARRSNRFWPAFSRSTLSVPIRAALGRDTLGPSDDATLLQFGIGFTDVVKLPSANAAGLKPADFATWAPRLLERLVQYQPTAACFHGLTAWRAFARYALGEPKPMGELGPQAQQVGATRLYVVPNPSPANAHFTPVDQAAWYDRLAAFLGGI